jgi:hypothetical protein
LQVDYADYGKYEFVSNGASFEEYFLRFYHRPFGDLADVASGRFDFMIRFERLQSDFSIVLDRLDIKQTRPIPVTNRTKGKRGTAESHYTPELVGRARQVFGPYMRKWGYDFPAGWGRNNPSWFRTLEYQFLTFVRALYLTRFRYDRGPLSRAVRRLRTLL